jgi:hypothetical protein
MPLEAHTLNSTKTRTQNVTDQAEGDPRGERRRGRGIRNAEGRRQGPGPFGKDGHHGHGPFAGKGHGPRGGRGLGRPGGWQQADLLSADDAAAWFAGRLPEGLYVSAPSVSVDREEIIVIGEIAAPELPAGADEASTEAAVAGRIARFREETRQQRIALATEAQARYGRTVGWGARIGDTETHFSNAAVPVMTRLRQPERQVLDTLVDSGVARSRSDALSWTVKLVGEHTEDWLTGLRRAMADVDTLRTQGPEL